VTQQTDREDSVESNLRISAISTCCELVHAAARDVQQMFRDMLPSILDRIDAALKIQVVSKDDNENKEQLLGLLCALITVLFQRLEKPDILPHADRSIQYLLQVLQARNSNCYEEALLSVGAIASAVEEDFVVRKYPRVFCSSQLHGNNYCGSNPFVLVRLLLFYAFRNTYKPSCRLSSRVYAASKPSHSAS